MTTLSLAVEGVAAGGDGIGRHPDGRVVFVEGALPGERVDAEVTEERRDFLRAATRSASEGWAIRHESTATRS